MSFQHFMKDNVILLKRDGQRFSFKALVQPKSILTQDDHLPVEEGDSIERTLPNGLIEKYLVEDRGYQTGIGGIAAHYNMKVRKEGSFKAPQVGTVTNIYNLQGPNARVNISSSDSSINVQSITKNKLFQDLKEAVNKGVEDEGRRLAMNKAIEELEQAAGSGSFLDKYQEFISCAANHMSLLAPFLPALTQMLIT